MDTYLATLPPNWSDHFTEETIGTLTAALGPATLRMRLEDYLTHGIPDAALKLYSKDKKQPSPPIPSKVVHYNLRPPEAPKKMPVLGKGKKLTGTYVVMDDPNW